MELPANGPVRLNVGCGKRILPGWISIDAVKRSGVDIVADASKIPLPSTCADEVMAIHLVEHVHPWQVPLLLAEWHRLLKPGGILVLEMPDVVKSARNLIERMDNPDYVAQGGKHIEQMDMWSFYGDPRDEDPYMAHKWGWTFKTLMKPLRSTGFREIRELPTQWHPVGRDHRDFRVEAFKCA